MPTYSLVPQVDPEKARRVFVVHGRNMDARNAMFAFLRALRLDPIEWSEALSWTGSASPYIGQVLEVAFQRAQAVVVLMTPDEFAYLQSQYAEHPSETNPEPQARPNVLFEAGMAMGHDPDRTVLVELGRVRPFSDVGGRHAVRLSNDVAARNDLAKRLKTAGCAANTDGSDWLKAGDFTPPQSEGGTLPVGKRVPATQAPLHRVDAKYLKGSKAVDRIQVMNRGGADLFDVYIELPEGVAVMLLEGQEKQAKLPAGRNYSVQVMKAWNHGGPEAFEFTVHATTDEGKPFSQPVFIDTSE